MSKSNFEFPDDLLKLSASLRKFVERNQATRFKIIIDRNTQTQNISIRILQNVPITLPMVEEASGLFHNPIDEPSQIVELDTIKWYQGWQFPKSIHIREDSQSPNFIAIVK